MKFFEYLKQRKIKNKFKLINKKKYNIFVVYHKPWRLLENEVVTPIHAGREIMTAKSKDGTISPQDYMWMLNNMVGDNTGVNISDKNRYFAENTVSYWMWKNIKSPYVGLMHYRRVFDMSGIGNTYKTPKNFLEKVAINKKNLDKIFSEYDIILPLKLGFNESIYQQYAKWHIIEDLDFVLDYIKERYPEVSPFAQKIKSSNTGYFYNMFVTSREIFDEYAHFLFDVLFAFSRQLQDRESKHIYQQRAEGYLAERLTGIYFDYLINTKNLKVKELPVVSVDENKEKTSKINLIRFSARNSKGKGLTFFLKIKF